MGHLQVISYTLYKPAIFINTFRHWNANSCNKNATFWHELNRPPFCCSLWTYLLQSFVKLVKSITVRSSAPATFDLFSRVNYGSNCCSLFSACCNFILTYFAWWLPFGVKTKPNKGVVTLPKQEKVAPSAGIPRAPHKHKKHLKWQTSTCHLRCTFSSTRYSSP